MKGQHEPSSAKRGAGGPRVCIVQKMSVIFLFVCVDDSGPSDPKPFWRTQQPFAIRRLGRWTPSDPPSLASELELTSKPSLRMLGEAQEPLGRNRGL